MKPIQSPNFIFMLGRNASGKDTQADLLLKDLGNKAVRISPGEIYRGAKTPTGKYGQYHHIVQPYIAYVDQGGLFPDEVVMQLIKGEVSRLSQGGVETFVMTGFPRTLGQLVETDSMLSEFPQSNADFLYYSISDDTARQRTRTRRGVMRAHGEDIRHDDLDEIIEERLRAFKEVTPNLLLGLVDFHPVNFHVIPAEGTVEEVHALTLRALGMKPSLREGIQEESAYLPQAFRC